jgi:hypothetical protein
MNKGRINRKWRRAPLGALTIFLLVLYVVGSLQVESFHRLLHGHDEAALHSPEQEESDCHRLVYHNQSKGDCKHDSHVTENKKCPLCQISVQQLHIAVDIDHKLFTSPIQKPASDFSETLLTATLPKGAARAPPFFS